MSLGIPYARGEIVKTPAGLTLVKTCPECDERIVCSERKDFESFTGREYAEHYDRHHRLE